MTSRPAPAGADPARLSADEVAWIQRHAGNAATADLLAPVQRFIDPAQLEARQFMNDIAADARRLVATHRYDHDALGEILITGATDWRGAQVAYRVMRTHPDPRALALGMARWLRAADLPALSANDWTRGVLNRLATTLRSAGVTAEAQRLIAVLVSPEHAHLVGETATASPAVAGSLAARGASVQSITEGSGQIVFDEYWIVVDAMPPGLTAKAYLTELTEDLNAAVRSEAFDRINVFRRTQQDRARGAPAVGDVYDIDIIGPDNGSVVLVERTPEHFIFQTITTTAGQTGSHPECGSREFGFQRLDGGAVRFYTRGASSPELAVGHLGGPVQEAGWTALLQGIGAALGDRGGRVRANSFGHWIRR